MVVVVAVVMVVGTHARRMHSIAAQLLTSGLLVAARTSFAPVVRRKNTAFEIVVLCWFWARAPPGGAREVQGSPSPHPKERSRLNGNVQARLLV